MALAVAGDVGVMGATTMAPVAGGGGDPEFAAVEDEVLASPLWPACVPAHLADVVRMRMSARQLNTVERDARLLLYLDLFDGGPEAGVEYKLRVRGVVLGVGVEEWCLAHDVDLAYLADLRQVRVLAGWLACHCGALDHRHIGSRLGRFGDCLGHRWGVGAHGGLVC